MTARAGHFQKLFFAFFLIFFALPFASGKEKREQKASPKQAVFPPADESVLDLLTGEDIAHPNAFWGQVHLASSIYDAKRQVIAGRWTLGLQGGKRFGRWGVFGQIEFDQNIDLTQEVDQLNVLHLGPGVEALALNGRLRSSLSVGPAILLTSTDIDKKGAIGWYLDIRPISARWGLGHKSVLEFTPLSIDLSIPVTHGIPLVVFSYMTVISVEWAGDEK